VKTPARSYHFDFYGVPVSTKPTATTQAQFNRFLQTVTFDAESTYAYFFQKNFGRKSRLEA
jgi:hypothetical protein